MKDMRKKCFLVDTVLLAYLWEITTANSRDFVVYDS